MSMYITMIEIHSQDKKKRNMTKIFIRNYIFFFFIFDVHSSKIDFFEIWKFFEIFSYVQCIGGYYVQSKHCRRKRKQTDLTPTIKKINYFWKNYFLFSFDVHSSKIDFFEIWTFFEIFSLVLLQLKFFLFFIDL